MDRSEEKGHKGMRSHCGKKDKGDNTISQDTEMTKNKGIEKITKTK